jgi:hypothetical protein
MNLEAKDTPIVNSVATLTQRDNAVREWIQGLRRLHDLLKSNASQAIVEGTLYSVEECAGLGIPIKSPEGKWGLRLLDVPEGGFALAPLVKSDDNLHPYFAKQLSGPSYQETCRTIFLPPDQLGPTWRGLILIHEVNHAMRHQDRTYRRLKLDHWVEEYGAYNEEIELVQEIYGQPYAEAVHQLSLDFEDQLKKGKLHLEVSKYARAALLESLFGKPESEFERSTQRGVFIFDALYRALDRLHPDGNKKEHYTVTEWLATSALNKNKV